MSWSVRTVSGNGNLGCCIYLFLKYTRSGFISIYSEGEIRATTVPLNGKAEGQELGDVAEISRCDT